MLGQAVLEEPSQLLLDRVGARATRAAIEVGAHRALGLEPQAALLIVEQVQPHLIAGHASLTVRSPSACAGAPPGLGRASISPCRPRSRRRRRLRLRSGLPDPAGSPCATPPRASSRPTRSRRPRPCAD